MQFLRRKVDGPLAGAPSKGRRFPMSLMEKRRINFSSRSMKGSSDDGDDKFDATLGTLSLLTQEMTVSTLSSAGFRVSSSRRRSTNIPFSSLGPLSDLDPEVERPVSYEIVKNDLDELGYLRFGHENVSHALEAARDSMKPVFSLEAVIPGDVDAGMELLSHPLLVEAAETLFVTCKAISEEPMARSPNGKPCYTRIRFLDPDTGYELVPLVSGDSLSMAGLISGMIKALESMSVSVPKYLQLVLQEAQGRSEFVKGEETRSRVHRALFAMDDLVRGEAEFGHIEGVLSTRVGRLGREKVVEVMYDLKELSYSVLVRHAIQNKLGNIIYYQCNEERMVAIIEVTRLHTTKSKVTKFDPDKCHVKYNNYDPKHALRATPMRFVPLTSLQGTRANSLIQSGKFNEAVQLLSPRQGAILMKAMRVREQKSLHEVVDVPISLAWKSVCTHQHPKHILQEMEPVQDDSFKGDDEEYNLICTI